MKRLLHILAPAGFFSARYFATRAAGLCVLFALAHLCGLREYTTLLSGTVEGADMRTSMILGSIYLLLYFAAVLVAPVLALAAGILRLCQILRGA